MCIIHNNRVRHATFASYVRPQEATPKDSFHRFLSITDFKMALMITVSISVLFTLLSWTSASYVEVNAEKKYYEIICNASLMDAAPYSVLN